MDDKDLQFIKNLYWQQIGVLKQDNNLSPEILIKKGVRQGCILSPILFNIYSEEIFNQISEHTSISIQINGHRINNIRYADDTILIAENEQDLQTLLDKLNEVSISLGLKINKNKTKVMRISKTHSNINIKINNTTLEQVKNYRYLGSIINSELDPNIEINTRIALARQAFIKWKTNLTNNGLNIATRLKTLKCYIWSILLYNVETWTLLSTTIKKLEALEMWFYRRMLKISWTDKITNAEVLKRLNTQRELIPTRIKRKCQYFGHIIRNNSKYKFLTTILQGRIPGKKKPGRQKTTWLQNIKKWTNTSMEQLLRTAKDRKQYKTLIAYACRQH